MRYLADLLTFTRILLAFLLMGLAFTQTEIGLGLVVFLLGELTDAFDGTCATRWPFPKGKAPWYRKYAAKYDMVADALMALAMVLFFSLRVNLVAGVTVLAMYVVAGLIIEFVVYRKLLGHPDDFKPGALMQRNFKLAKRLILVRRNVYLGLMMAISIATLYSSGWAMGVKIGITVVGLGVSLFLWIFLAQRRHNISRDAVEIEKKLADKPKTSGK